MASDRVYINNLSWAVTDEEISNHLSSAGPVVSVDIYRMRDGRSKGCGIVRFETAEAAQNAIKDLNESELSGRKIQIREDREGPEGPRARPRAEAPARNSQQRTQAAPRRQAAPAEGRAPAAPGTSVYVGNLPWSVNWSELKTIFQDYNPTFTNVVFRDGRSRGFGVVRFNTPEEAAAAIEGLNDTVVGDRNIVVRLDQKDN